MRELSNLEVV